MDKNVSRRHASEPAKNNWFQQKALAAQAGRQGGKVVWKYIRDMQQVRERFGSTEDSKCG